MGVRCMWPIAKLTDVLVLRLSSCILFHLPYCFVGSFQFFHCRITARHLASLNIWDQRTVKDTQVNVQYFSFYLILYDHHEKKHMIVWLYVRMPTYSRLVEWYYFNLYKLDYYDRRTVLSYIGCNIQFRFNSCFHCIGFCVFLLSCKLRLIQIILWFSLN